MTRSYGQFCGLAKALEMIGERWSMLVLRDLVLGSKRFTELRRGLPRIPESILVSRLNELEQHGVVRRRMRGSLDASVVYELTEYGSELEGILLELGIWGARSLGDPCSDEVFTLDAAILSLHASFRPERAAGIHVALETRFAPGLVVHAVVYDGLLSVAEGSHPDPDLVVEARGPLRGLLAGEVTAAEAVGSGLVHLIGEPHLLDLYTDLFHIPAAPCPEIGLVAR